MKQYAAKSNNSIITQNTIIQKKNYTSIQITNKGTVNLFVNDNIELEPGDVWSFVNLPHVFIDENTSVRFAPGAGTKKALAEFVYYSEIK